MSEVQAGSADFVGVAVAKAELRMSCKGVLETVPNRKPKLQRWLGTLPENCHMAMEATSTYHEALAELAQAAGHTVYVVNPKHIKHYRTATQGRAKTDLCDAQLLARYVEHEHIHLHPWTPLSPAARKMCTLLRRRATVVRTKTQLVQALEIDAKALGLARKLRGTLDSIDRLLAEMDKQLELLLQHPAHREASARLQSIVGIGPLNAAALLVALQRGNFATPDAFVAFLGLDPVPRDSGQSCGRRRLSKQGDSETRRLLFNAAMSACATQLWRPFYKRYLDRGLKRVQILCIIARKLVRIAWSLHKYETNFSPERFAATLT